MKKKWAFLCCLGIVIFSCIGIYKISQKGMPPQKTRPVESTQGPYFLPVDIVKLTLANQPCLNLEINGNVVSAMLDLGFRGQFGLSDQFLETIKNKKYLQSTTMYGVRGHAHEEKLYEIPTIKVGPVSFSASIVHEYSETFHKNATLIRGSDEISSPEPGKVGWELFGNTNLFLDLKNSKIAFCDSMNTLKDQGHAVENFIKTPLFLERGLVEFEATTLDGPLRCVLDTGATYNILNSEIEEGKSIEQIVQDPNYITNYASFTIYCARLGSANFCGHHNGPFFDDPSSEILLQYSSPHDRQNLSHSEDHQNSQNLTAQSIANNEFGPIDFHRIPIKIPIHIEAILGMEFFQAHLVFIDFLEKQIYFLKNPKTQ